MKYECFEGNCYNLYTVKTTKFRNCHLEIVFRGKCSKESITYSALLFDVLMENNKTYNTRKLLARKCQELYNLAVYSINSRVGDMLLSNIIADFIDPKFMEEDVTEEIMELVFSFLFNPNIEADEFDEETFNIVKKRLKNEISSLKEDPKQYSILEAMKNIDETSPRAFNTSGDENILDDITPKKLYKYYLDLLENNLVDIYIIGNLEMKNIKKVIHKYAKFNSIKTENINIYLDDINMKKAKVVKEKSSTTQTNLVQIYSLNKLTDYEIDYIMPIFNLLWGSGSLESKVYKAVRGKNSLCYNINTYYQKYDKCLIVHTAIDSKNYDKTIKLIKSCLDEMINGNISEEELANIKNMMINSLNLTYDNPGRIIDNYLFKNIVGLEDIEDRIDKFKRVTLGELVTTSKKIKLVLTYRMGE